MSNRLNRGGVQRLLDVLAGIWLIISPFYWGISDPAQRWTSVILGIVVVIVGSLMIYEAGKTRRNRFSFGWINVIFGLGAIAYPFYFGLTGRAVVSYLVAGVLIVSAAVVASLRSYAGPNDTRP